jgi:hypothetical protein
MALCIYAIVEVVSWTPAFRCNACRSRVGTPIQTVTIPVTASTLTTINTAKRVKHYFISLKNYQTRVRVRICQLHCQVIGFRY